MPYWCVTDSHYFSVRSGTCMEHSRLPMRKWVLAVFLIIGASKGMSSYRMARLVGVTQHTAWYLMHRIRAGFRLDGIAKLHGAVEIDES